MKDGPYRAAIKHVAARAYLFELAVRRVWLRRRGQLRWELGGACQGCAKCCEAPAISLPRSVWRFEWLRRGFLAWQKHVNGFELRRTDAANRVYVFDCTHFDRKTRRCDSYETRPAMCRDYPRRLLEDPWPELRDGCGFRAVDRRGDAFAAALAETALPPEKLDELKRRLKLE